jgi:hypothetical protein
MRARTILWLGLALLFVVVLWAVLRPASRFFVAQRDNAAAPPDVPAPELATPPPPPPPSSAPASPFLSGTRPEQAGAPATIATTPLSAVTSPPAPPLPDAELITALEEVQVMIRDYRTALGENPVGTNAEIMRAINGDNKKQAKIGPPPGQQLNGKGELVDRWGTPYFFHQISGNEMEIRSAGPDRVMWTADDRQVK